jgi:hypothetical protein
MELTLYNILRWLCLLLFLRAYSRCKSWKSSRRQSRQNEQELLFLQPWSHSTTEQNKMLPHAHLVPNIHVHISEHMQLNTCHFNQRQAGNLSARYQRHILCYKKSLVRSTPLCSTIHSHMIHEHRSTKILVNKIYKAGSCHHGNTTLRNFCKKCGRIE